MAEQAESNRFPLEKLQNMKLPEVPEELSKLLSVTWKGRGGIPATSAVGALVDKAGNPLTIITLVYKRYIHEEELPYKDVNREMQIFAEVAGELYRATQL